VAGHRIERSLAGFNYGVSRAYGLADIVDYLIQRQRQSLRIERVTSQNASHTGNKVTGAPHRPAMVAETV
jgi:hypothetical protein